MKKNKLTTIISVSLLILALFSTLLLNDYWGSRVSEVVTIGTAIIGAVALFFQFKRDKDINQATFIVEFWKTFTDNEKLQVIMLKCDDMRLGKKNTFTDEDYFDIVTYAQWLETLASLINRKIVSYDAINDMYNYLYFVFVNNPYIQKIELEPNKAYYHGIYSIYEPWKNYLEKKNLPLIGIETKLNATHDNNSTNLNKKKDN